MSVSGRCLCGEVAFVIEGRLPRLYRCHCSRCRRQSGAEASAALLIRAENFRWSQGRAQIVSFSLATGFRSDFCRRCGSPVPNDLDRVLPGYLWVPAGLLDPAPGLTVGAHLFLGSRAPWDQGPFDGQLHDGLPEDLPAFLEALTASSDGSD